MIPYFDEITPKRPVMTFHTHGIVPLVAISLASYLLHDDIACLAKPWMHRQQQEGFNAETKKRWSNLSKRMSGAYCDQPQRAK
jgi:hypothetical protein